MNAEPPFRRLAGIALRDPALAGMQAIVEKELLHYELLQVLEQGRWLDGLVFQGGTALRLCHGASRLSEDLDFSGGPEFAAGRMDGLAAFLERNLAERGLGVSVKLPKKTANHGPSAGVGVSTWRIDIETRSGRRDLPRQRIKLDIDNAPSYTGEIREILQNYDAARDLGMLVRVQSREEILANKLVAFPASVANRDRPRHRDIWDIRWLVGNGTEVRGDLVSAKLRDHCADPAWMGAAAAKAVEIVQSPAFAAEMRRFLLPNVVRRTLDDPRYLEFLGLDTERLLLEADKGLRKEGAGCYDNDCGAAEPPWNAEANPEDEDPSP